MVFTQCCIYPCLSGLGQTIISNGTEGYCIVCTVIHHLPLQYLREAIGVHRFATNFGWSCSFPMKLKREAHEALSLFVQWDGVSSAIIIIGEFNRKLKEASCHLIQTEPFTPNVAERERKELKRGSGRKLIKSGSPKRFWEDIIMSRESSNISLFCEFEWFEWVMF